MTGMKQFVTAAKNHAEAAQKPDSKKKFGRTITVEIDDREVQFGNVTGSQMLMMIAMEGQSERARLATVINFFFSVIISESDKGWLKSRLFDNDDEFGEEMMSDIVIYLLEEWGERPTKPSSDSSITLERTGQSSTENSQVEA